MSRPPKDGVDYFPLDVNMDEKIELIEAEFGLDGFGVVVKLYQKIYSQGCYVEWTNEIALLFAKKIGVGGGVVSEIVAASIRRGIFDRNLFERYQILTSRGIQKRYFEAVSRRKQIEVKMQYLLVNVAEICANVSIIEVNVSNNPENVRNNPTKESKVKESKVKEREHAPARFEIPTVAEIRAYCQERGNRIDPQRFFDHYEAQGWAIKDNLKMADWKATVRRWEQQEGKYRKVNKATQTCESSIDPEELQGILYSQFAGRLEKP